jgi:phosphotransferase system HPr-like phosphotransfer protein
MELILLEISKKWKIQITINGSGEEEAGFGYPLDWYL